MTIDPWHIVILAVGLVAAVAALAAETRRLAAVGRRQHDQWRSLSHRAVELDAREDAIAQRETDVVIRQADAIRRERIVACAVAAAVRRKAHHR